MLAARLLTILVACVFLAACDDKQSTPTPPPSNGERITGSERIGWDQPAANAAELASFRYAIYVDGTRSELTDVACSTTAGPAGFPCSAALPSMTAGSHTLEVAAFVVDGAVLESGKSTALRVERIGAAMTSAGSTWRTDVAVSTVDRLQLQLQLVTDGLTNPTDLAFAEDGRIFVAEQSGRIRVVRNDQLQIEPALTLGDTPTTAGGGLLALTLDPQFPRTGFVYAIYTAESARQGRVFRLARFREVGGELAQQVVLLDGIPASSEAPTASLHFGPDGKLYAAFDDGGDERRSGDLASFNGKILRLNPDGSTPGDQAAATPVFLADLRSPRGFDWRPAEGTVWIAETASDTSEQLQVFMPGSRSSESRSAVLKYALPQPVGASDITFYRGELLPAFRGDLLVAADEGRHILRLRFDARRGSIAASERLLHDRVGPVRVVGIGTRGEIYFCTPDALGRLVPL
jgi:glucose/arabinose dehydrogenase